MADNFLTQLLSPFVLVLLPIFAGLMIISPFFPNNQVKIRRFAKGFAAFNLVYSVLFVLITGVGAESFIRFGAISLGIDKFSSLMCLLTSFIMLIALIVSKSMIRSKQKKFYGLMLLLMGGLTGVFSSDSLFAFAAFYALSLLPAYFLVSIRGGSEAKKAAEKFILFGSIGLIFLMLSSALISSASTIEEFPIDLQTAASIGFLIAFGIMTPIFPFHKPVIKALTEAPAPVSIVLSGIMLNIGIYGIIRINMQMFSEPLQLFAPGLIILGATGIIWGLYLAISKSDIKNGISSAAVSFMGIPLMGAVSFTDFGTQGAVFCLIAHSLIFSGLYIISEIIYLKFKTRKLEFLCGILNYSTPFAIITLIFCLSSALMPLTIGFPGAILCLTGSFNTPLVEAKIFGASAIQIFVILAVLSIILSSAYTLRLMHKAFFGPIEESGIKYDDIKEPKITILGHQLTVLAILVIGIIIFGIYPMGIIDIIGNFGGNLGGGI